MRTLKYFLRMHGAGLATASAKREFTMGLVLGMIWLCAGCASTRFESKAIAPVSNYRLHQAVDGLDVAVEPLSNPDEMQRLFRMNLLDKGILAVFVVATNSSPGTSFLVAPEQFTLANRTGQATQDRTRNPDSPSAAGVAAVVAAGVPGLLIASLAGQNPDQWMANNQNFHHQELGRHTLSPGGNTSGYVFFQIPKTKDPSPDWVIVYKVSPLGTDAPKEMSFHFTVSTP
jgi:hypothetical protein